ncbi:MAG TPA: transposase [Kofleriaceae bacterium]|nr:transposase [Kofleriaceae bacterium]
MATKPKRRRRDKQLELGLVRGRGGPGRGQGRKKRRRDYVPHRRRPFLDGRHVLHVTLTVVDGLPSLRGRTLWAAVRRGFVRGHKTKLGFRIVHYTVDGKHIHLICEARTRSAMSRGMQGFKSCVGKAINKALGGRRGAVFTDRYHERIITNPTQCRNTLAYVLGNQRHHAYAEGASYPPGRVDPYSSAVYFDGWTRRAIPWGNGSPGENEAAPPGAAPETWLLRVGWRRAGGPISPSHVPGLPPGAPALPVW